MSNIHHNQSSGPLSGITVVEFAVALAAPSVGRVLTYLGATVIKEESAQGDFMRKQGANHGCPIDDNNNPCFNQYNSGKQLISLNLKDEDDIKAFHNLLSKADIFLTNTRAKALKKLKLDYDTLSALYPKLIMAHFTGYGLEGKDKDRPAFDYGAFWLRTGGSLSWQTPGSFPLRPSLGFADTAAAGSLTTGILAAIIGREKTGKGTYVTTSLFENGLWFNAMALLGVQHGKKFQPGRNEAMDPFTHYYETSDGKWIGIFISVYEVDKDRFADFFGLDFMKTDERYNSIKVMRQEGLVKECVLKLVDIFKGKKLSEWEEALIKADIPFEVLRNFDEVILDEQAFANNALIKCVGTGDVLYPAVPIKFSNYECEMIKNCGGVGCDDERVVREL